MGVSLIDRYDGDFMKVCEHYADVLGDRKLNGKQRELFIEWMYLTKDYSPNNYKRMFANPSLYFRMFKVNQLINSGDEQHCILTVTGKIGKGKTTLGIQCAALVDPSFCMEKVCYLPHQFFQAVQTAKPGQAIIIDEGGNFFKALNTLGKMSKNLGQYFQMMRAKRLFIIICYDEFEKMNREIRDKVDIILMKVTKKDEPAPRKFQYWVGWNNKGSEQVVNFLNAKKLPLSTPPLMRYAGLRGVNSAEFPVLNDISEQAFKDNKLKNVKDFEEQFLKEALKSFGLEEDHYTNETKNNTMEDVKSNIKQMVSVSHFSKVHGISTKTVYKRINEGIFEHIRIPGEKKDMLRLPLEQPCLTGKAEEST